MKIGKERRFKAMMREMAGELDIAEKTIQLGMLASFRKKLMQLQTDVELEKASFCWHFVVCNSQPFQADVEAALIALQVKEEETQQQASRKDFFSNIEAQFCFAGGARSSERRGTRARRALELIVRYDQMRWP